MTKLVLSSVALLVFTSVTLAQRVLKPLVDHHTHISSIGPAALTVEPLRPVIELPAELALLLRNIAPYM